MANNDSQKHPKGLYVLFGTEMWERFSFYSMLALFTLYLRDPTEGFGWTADRSDRALCELFDVRLCQSADRRFDRRQNHGLSQSRDDRRIFLYGGTRTAFDSGNLGGLCSL